MSGTQAKISRKSAKFSKFVTDPISASLIRKADAAAERKGFDPAAQQAKKSKEKKTAERKQTELIGKQKQDVELSLAESVDEIGRAKLLRKTGGRRSLIASR